VVSTDPLVDFLFYRQHAATRPPATCHGGAVSIDSAGRLDQRPSGHLCTVWAGDRPNIGAGLARISRTGYSPPIRRHPNLAAARCQHLGSRLCRTDDYDHHHLGTDSQAA
jgi:hypothetical protein